MEFAPIAQCPKLHEVQAGRAIFQINALLHNLNVENTLAMEIVPCPKLQGSGGASWTRNLRNKCSSKLRKNFSLGYGYGDCAAAA